MSKKRFIIIGSILLLLCTVVIFVFKVSGSNGVENISGCTPFNVNVQKGNQEYGVNITWETKDVCSGFVVYGERQDDLKLVSVDIENGVKNSKHEVSLSALVSTKVYYFSIISDSVDYGKNGLPISFTLNSL